MLAARAAALLRAAACLPCAGAAPGPAGLGQPDGRRPATVLGAELAFGTEAATAPQVAFDTEATVLDFSAAAQVAEPASPSEGIAERLVHALGGAAHGAGLRWPVANPKNGTPWYRFKPVGDRGTAGHPHFSGLSSTGDFPTDMLQAHNTVRTRAGLAPLEWNRELAALASSRVHTLSRHGCYIQHSPLEHRWQKASFVYIGENLYKVINMVPTGVDIVDAWYAEVEDYSYGPVGESCTKAKCADRVSPPCTLGHFTQVMWARTTDLGCAIAECYNEPRPTFVSVCNYGPGGNIVGRLPFDSTQATAVGMAQQSCTAPSVSPFSLKHSRTAALRSAAPHGAAGRVVLALAALLLALGPGAPRAVACARSGPR